jgi:hypothetical protein
LQVPIRNREYAGVATLAVIAAYFLIWPLWRAFFPLEIGPTEGWNAYHQDVAFTAALYPPAGSLAVNNYPPLSFYAVAGIAKLVGGDSLYVGRALTLLATLGIGAGVAAAVRLLCGGAIAAAIAGLWVVGILVRSFNGYVGRDDPQLIAQFIMLVALVWFLHRDAKGKSAVPPVLLMVVAGFFKHNIIAVPATVLIWLAMRDGRRAIAPIVIGAVAAVFGLALCTAIYGEPFIANMLAPRAHRFGRVISSLGRLQWVAPGLVIWAIWAWSERATALARFSILYVTTALVAYLLQWSGESVLDNAQFDLIVAVAVGLGLAYERIGASPLAARFGAMRVRAAMVAILVLRLVATGRVEPALILFDPQYRALFPQYAEIARQEALRVANIPGPVECSNKLVCRMSGKPFAADDFTTGQLVATGAMTQAQLDALLRRRGITYVEVDPRATIDSLYRDIFANFFRR